MKNVSASAWVRTRAPQILTGAVDAVDTPYHSATEAHDTNAKRSNHTPHQTRSCFCYCIFSFITEFTIHFSPLCAFLQTFLALGPHSQNHRANLCKVITKGGSLTNFQCLQHSNKFYCPREVLRGPGSNPGRGIHIFHQTSLILLSNLHS